MKPHVYFGICDNGLGLSRTRWACSMFDAALSGVLSGRKVTWNHFSYPYPNGIMQAVSHNFLNSEADELVMIDTDIIFTPKHLEWLLSHDVPYVGGIVPKRVMGLELAIFPYEPMAQNPLTEGVNPLIDADCGRGFVRIHRSVFETLKPHVPTYQDDQEQGSNGTLRYEFFQSKPGGHSEDFSFCELYRKLGGKPYVDQRITLHHEGSVIYPIKGTY